MITQITSGTIEPGTTSEWREVPQSRVYVFSLTSGDLALEVSVDGVNRFEMSNSLTAPLASITSLPPKAYRITDIPVGFMRVRNRGIDPVTEEVFVASAGV